LGLSECLNPRSGHSRIRDLQPYEEGSVTASRCLIIAAASLLRQVLDDGVGAMVMNVDKSGPSSAAGIRQGDVIVGWNDDRISGVRSLLQALGPDSVGSAVEVTVRRAGEPVRLKLTIGERPET
jgi:S1-C subfamily serine protease